MASIIASIIGYSVYASVDGWEPIFLFNPVSFTQPAELPFFILLALVVMVVGVIYTKIFYGTKSLFNRITIPVYMKPVLGGVAVGIIAYFFPAIIGSSYGYLQMALNGDLTVSFMAGLVVFKILATSLTIQSGGSGGVFAPSLVIGGLIGGIFGYGVQSLAPGLVSSPEAFVLVGMASFFAGVANVPVSATIMISEMSKSYGLIVPLIFASAIAYLGTQGWSIYKEQLLDHRSSASYRDELMYNILRQVKVRSAYQKVERMPTINYRNTVSEVLNIFSRSDTVVLPVENDEKEIVGLISLYSVRELIQQDVGGVIIAADIMHPPRFLYLNDPLSKAFRYFIESEEPEIPVLQPGGGSQCIGVLSERDFLLEYERHMTHEKEGKE